MTETTQAADPEAMQQQWEALASKALRGKPLHEIQAQTAEGIALPPIFFDAGGHAAQTNARPGWDARAWLGGGGAEEAQQALADGADSLWIPPGANVDDLSSIAAKGVVIDRDDAVISGLPSHERGADDASELADIVAAHRQRGGDLVRVSVGCELFVGVAKLRALRCLLPGVAVHAVQGRRWLASRDVPTNMIRSTLACFVGAIGGADIITTLPFDATDGPGSRHARRVAVTLHAVAARESHLGQVADPAAGSFLLERLTASLIAATNERLSLPTKRDYSGRRGPTIGVTLYPNPTEAK